MAAEASTARFTLSYQQMGRKSRPWGTAEIQCTQCGRRVSRVSGEEIEGGPFRAMLCLGHGPFKGSIPIRLLGVET